MPAILNHPCSCDRHPGNANGKCGATYLYFGHEGLGMEPRGRGHHCENCDSCYPFGFGLAALEKQKQNIQKWLESDGASLFLGETTFIMRKASYTIRGRLFPKFGQSVLEKNIGTVKSPVCDAMFLLETDIPGEWERNKDGKMKLSTQPHYDVYQSHWVLDPKQLEADIRNQNPFCPICRDPLRLMMHEGWVNAEKMGHGKKRRPFRVYYLSCNHDWTSYRPNGANRTNEGAPSFNPHPTNKNNQCSFWHSQQRY